MRIKKYPLRMIDQWINITELHITLELEHEFGEIEQALFMICAIFIPALRLTLDVSCWFRASAGRFNPREMRQITMVV